MVAALATAVLLAAQTPAQEPGTVTFREGARSPAIGPDGRIAVALRGDLWLIPAAGGAAIRLTEGPAWDREPAWSADGAAIVFASDREPGSTDLWRIDVRAAGAAGEPVRLTTTPGTEAQPTTTPDGGTVFVRGEFANADLWLRRADGTETRLTTEVGAEVEPAVSADGSRIAFIAVRDGDRVLHVARLAEGALQADRAVHETRPAAQPAWSPDGERIAFATGGGGRGGFGGRGGGAGVFVTDASGDWLQQASARTGDPAWAPDGGSLVIAELDGPDAGYNGDPDRLGDRAAGDIHVPADGALRRVRVPAWPDAAEDTIAFTASMPRAAFHGDAFDRVWQRVVELYFPAGAGPATRRTSAGGLRGEEATRALREWDALGERYRARAIAAPTTDALEDVLAAFVADRPSLRMPAQGRAGVSSAHPAATAAGVEILEAGGNVVDAAIAVSFALGVVEPDASGMGGYGEMVLFLRGMEAPTAIEFMTRVPEHAGLDNPALDDLPSDGPMLALVPGPVAGMGLAFERYGGGDVSWARILEPAIRLAEQGFILDDAFTTTLKREREAFARWESSRKLFFDAAGEPLEPGDTLRNPDLAWTLRQIAAGGWKAFYTGAPAERLVDDLRSHGHPVTMHDMARYFAKERTPVTTTYRGHTIFSGPPPVTGGALLAAKLNLLEQAPRGASITEDPAKLHAMIEAWKLQPSTGGRIADPDSWPVDITPFESKDSAAVRWQCFDPARASQSSDCERPRTEARLDDAQAAAQPASHTRIGSHAPQPATPFVDSRGIDEKATAAAVEGTGRQTGTTAFAVADAAGNMVAVTQTLGTWGGNFYVTPGLGFLYNDKMRSHGSDPERYNARIPYARTGTVIAPTLVFRGTGDDLDPLLAVGAAGNAWITSAVYQAVVGVIDHDMGPQEALEMPRFLPGGGGSVSIEAGLSPAAIRRLDSMGHRFNRISLTGELRMGYGAAVLVGDGRVTVGADPRRSGAAGVLR
jgi:gamma-glutamyltranspeptidase